MFNSIFNNEGFNMIEVVIALFLTTIGVISLLSMQSLSWQTAGRSDLLGRAAAILQEELTNNELAIMNPLNAVNTGTTTSTVNPSGESTAQSGDISYTVQTNITDNGDGSWTVAVGLTWPGNNTGISESIIATRQEPFRF